MRLALLSNDEIVAYLWPDQADDVDVLNVPIQKSSRSLFNWSTTTSPSSTAFHSTGDHHLPVRLTQGWISTTWFSPWGATFAYLNGLNGIWILSFFFLPVFSCSTSFIIICMAAEGQYHFQQLVIIHFTPSRPVVSLLVVIHIHFHWSYMTVFCWLASSLWVSLWSALEWPCGSPLEQPLGWILPFRERGKVYLQQPFRTVDSLSLRDYQQEI